MLRTTVLTVTPSPRRSECTASSGSVTECTSRCALGRPALRMVAGAPWTSRAALSRCSCGSLGRRTASARELADGRADGVTGGGSAAAVQSVLKISMMESPSTRQW